MRSKNRKYAHSQAHIETIAVPLRGLVEYWTSRAFCLRRSPTRDSHQFQRCTKEFTNRMLVHFENYNLLIMYIQSASSFSFAEMFSQTYSRSLSYSDEMNLTTVPVMELCCYDNVNPTLIEPASVLYKASIKFIILIQVVQRTSTHHYYYSDVLKVLFYRKSSDDFRYASASIRFLPD